MSPSRSSPEEDLILWSAGTAVRRAGTLTRAESLVERMSWPRLEELLRLRRLLPTLGPRILGLAEERAREDFRASVADAVESARRQAALVGLIGSRVMDALTEAGIRSCPLKGPLLGEALYGDPGRRPSADIDLLVEQEQLYEAVSVVRAMGYARPRDHVADDGMPLLHFALVHAREELPPVELHWRVHWYESRFAGERLLAPGGEHTDSWRAAPPDELTALLLYYARDGFAGLRHASDIGAWWDAFGGSLEPGALEEPLRAYPGLEPAVLTATRVAERLVGVPGARLLRESGRLGRRGRIAVRLAEPHPNCSEAQIYASMSLIDGLLSPRGGLRAFLRRQLGPSRAGAAQPACGLQGRWARSSAAHSVRMLSRYGLAMGRLLRTDSPA
jgi:hypothetical protein